MDIDYQKNVINYLLTEKEAKKFIDLVPPSFFTLSEDKFICDTLKKYWGDHRQQPSESNFFRYIEKEAPTDVTPEVLASIKAEIREVYRIDIGDFNIARKDLVEAIRKEELKLLLKSQMGDLDNPKVINKLMSGMNKIQKIGDHEAQEEGLWLFKDATVGKKKRVKVHPCYLKGMNALTAKGGFATPELIILMGAPKSFKTGWLINLIVGYLADGLNVYYADFENGELDILIRIQQCIADCNYDELNDSVIEPHILDSLRRMSHMGGELRIQSFIPYQSTLDDVEADIERLDDEFNFRPQLVAYDYLDLARCADSSIREDRKKLQNIYHHAIRINKKRKTFGMSPSQVNKGAVDKEVIDIKDFAEDFGKAANAHAAFAMCRTPEEVKAKVGRIVSVMQRQGQRHSDTNFVTVKIDEARSSIIEYNSFEDLTDE